jgi:hypothetical protein
MKMVQNQHVSEEKNGISIHKETESMQQGYAQIVQLHQAIGRQLEKTDLSFARVLLLE